MGGPNATVLGYHLHEEPAEKTAALVAEWPTPTELLYHGIPCRVVRERYPTGRSGLRVVSSHHGETLLMPTVDLPTVPLAVDEVIVKSSSSDHSALGWLLAHHIVTQTMRAITDPLIDYTICHLQYPLASLLPAPVTQATPV